jgi:hypothetical protein
MSHTVEVPIPVESEAAAELSDERKRAAVGRIVSRLLRPTADHDPLLVAMDELGEDAAAKGLTADGLGAELAAHRRERQR